MRAPVLVLVVAATFSFPAVSADRPAAADLIQDVAGISLALVPMKGTLSDATVRKALEPVAKKKGRTLEVVTIARVDYPGLGAESLEYTAASLTAADRAALERAPKAVECVITWSAADPGALREVYEAVATLASKHSAIIYDRNAATAYAVSQWRTDLIQRGWAQTVPVGPAHFNVHVVSQDNGLLMLDTGGLNRFGLTDLVLLDVNRSSLHPAGNLINAVAQRLIEGGRPDARGRLMVRVEELREPGLRQSIKKSSYSNAKREIIVGFLRADISLGARKEAVELTFPGIKCTDRGECLDAAIKALFGVADAVAIVKHDDAVLAAKARALADLRKYESKILKGLPHDEILLVKARFPHPEGNEWMWVDVESWSGKILRGRLENEPVYVTTVKAGATVEVKLEDLMDYMYKLGDGTFYGNEVGKVIEPAMFEDAGYGRSRIRQ